MDPQDVTLLRREYDERFTAAGLSEIDGQRVQRIWELYLDLWTPSILARLFAAAKAATATAEAEPTAEEILEEGEGEEEAEGPAKTISIGPGDSEEEAAKTVEIRPASPSSEPSSVSTISSDDDDEGSEAASSASDLDFDEAESEGEEASVYVAVPEAPASFQTHVAWLAQWPPMPSPPLDVNTAAALEAMPEYRDYWRRDDLIAWLRDPERGKTLPLYKHRLALLQAAYYSNTSHVDAWREQVAAVQREAPSILRTCMAALVLLGQTTSGIGKEAAVIDEQIMPYLSAEILDRVAAIGVNVSGVPPLRLLWLGLLERDVAREPRQIFIGLTEGRVMQMTDKDAHDDMRLRCWRAGYLLYREAYSQTQGTDPRAIYWTAMVQGPPNLGHPRVIAGWLNGDRRASDSLLDIALRRFG